MEGPGAGAGGRRGRGPEDEGEGEKGEGGRGHGPLTLPHPQPGAGATTALALFFFPLYSGSGRRGFGGPALPSDRITKHLGLDPAVPLRGAAKVARRDVAHSMPLQATGPSSAYRRGPSVIYPYIHSGRRARPRSWVIAKRFASLCMNVM